MLYLIAGIILFFGMHLVPGFAGVKANLITRFGEMGYRGLFSIIAALGLGLIIWGRASAGHDPVYAPPDWGRHAPHLFMLPVFILLAAANMKGRIRKITRHPMLLGVLMWAAAHLLVNGDVASILLFGSFAAFSVVDMVLANARGDAPVYVLKPVHDLMAIVGGALVYLVFLLFAHSFLFGVQII